MSIDDQIACVKRELGYRRRCYPKWVSEKRMPTEKATAELQAMEAVLATLEKVKTVQAPGLF